MSSSPVRVAALQSAFTDDADTNVARVTELVRAAAGDGARVILAPELFEGHYFPCAQRDEEFARAHPVDDHPTLAHFRELARELAVALPVSFFERAGQAYYNSVGMIDADGTLLGLYRKSHIPDGPGYMEKFYFRPGDTGFRAWKTRYGTVGVGICWDQWYPECARAMALLGADILFYPTAIGSEPHNPGFDTSDMWQRVMIGHAVANGVGLVAANRVGDEGSIAFYGRSFICDSFGEKRAELGRADEGFIAADLDPTEMQRNRAAFGFFRDRRPDLYQILTTADGRGDR